MDEETSERFSALETRLSAVETDLAVIRSNYVTKAEFATALGEVRADIAKLEATILKWFIATVITVTGLSFGIARFTI